MLFKSQVLAQASGSVNGLVYSHNRGGNYTRMRKTPVNPATLRQQAVRIFLGQAVQQWQGTLSAAERISWDTYAFNTPLIGPLGDPRNIGGIGMFIRQYVGAAQAGLTPSITAPTVWNTGDPPAGLSANVYDESAQTLSQAFDVLSPWYVAGGSLLLYQGRPQNATRNFFKGPWRFVGSITTPDTSPQVFGPPLPYTVTAGQKVFTQIRVWYPDGRLSQAVVINSIVVA